MNGQGLTIGRKLFLTHWLAVVLVSGSIGTYFYFSAAESLKDNLRFRLQNTAALMAYMLQDAPLDALRSAEDAAKPEYRDLLSRLRQYRRTNPDIAFVYVMRRTGDQIHFVLDSDESPAQALPGRPYTNELIELREGFRTPSVDPNLNRDEWGVFMSGYAPVRSGAPGEYMVGIDLRADEFSRKFQRLRLSGLLSLVASLLLALLFSRYFASRFVRQVRAFRERCETIAAGRFEGRLPNLGRDELDQLAASFNHMSDRLAAAQASLKAANEDLERQVALRTRELTARNEDLRAAVASVQTLSDLLPICASCKRIRNDAGYWTQVDEYMAQHSNMTFTHGLCPECETTYLRQVGDASRPSSPPAG